MNIHVNRRELLFKAAITVIMIMQSLMIVFYGNQKQGFVMDEYYTWMSANSYDNPEFVVPMNQWTDMQFLKDYFTVQEGERFSYASVWKNLKADVHPPLYSWLLHTVCSFFPNQLSKWFGIILNMLLAMGITVLVCTAARDLSGRRSAALAAALIYSCSSWAMSSAMYIRMYQLLVLMIMFSCCWHIRNTGRRQGINYKALVVITVVGALTHYYFLVYLFFEAACFCIYHWLKRDYRNLKCYILSMFCSGLIAVLVFPPMVRDIFFGYRGEEAFSNLVVLQGYWQALRAAWLLLRNNLLGGMPFTAVILAALLISGICICRYRKLPSFISPKFCVVSIPVVCYFLIVAKTAPYLTDRYYLGIGAAAIVVFVYMLSRVCDVSDSGWLRYITLPCVSVLLVAGSHHNGTVNYQSAELQDQRAILQEVESTQYLYVIDENMWKVMGNIQVLDHFDRLYCIEESSLPSIINEKQTFDKTLAVGIISTDTEKTLDFVKETLGYRSCEFLCGSGDTKTYYLKK